MPSIEEKNFYRELFSLAIPIGLQNLLVALIGATDALMLGRLSQDAVAAVSLANQIAFVMNLFCCAVIGGGGVLLAQYWGRNDRTMVKNIFCMLLKWTLGISAVFFIPGMFTPKLLMRIYTPDQALIEIGADYLRAVSISYLFLGITQCYYLIMKLEGKAGKCVVISIVTLAVDVLLDIFLIYGFAGVPKFGAVGSAYSTVAVEFIALIWCIAESYRGVSVRPDIRGFQWTSAVITGDLFKIALPMLASSLARGLGFSMHSLIIRRDTPGAALPAYACYHEVFHSVGDRKTRFDHHAGFQRVLRFCLLRQHGHRLRRVSGGRRFQIRCGQRVLLRPGVSPCRWLCSGPSFSTGRS